MRITRALLNDVVAHARKDYPNECCGLLGIDDGAVTALYPTENIHHSPLRFEIDGTDVLRIMGEVEGRGWSLGLYHSHTKSRAYPSQTDVNFAELWPGMVWLIVSLENSEAPELRAFAIDGERIDELGLSVD